MKTKQQNVTVDAIIEKFDFEKVHAAMAATGWTWFSEPGTPSIASLKKTAEFLLLGVLDDPALAFSSTGGFTAYRDTDEMGTVIGLEFMLTSADESLCDGLVKQSEAHAALCVSFHERLVEALTVTERRLRYVHALRCHAQPEDCVGCSEADACTKARALLAEIQKESE